MKPSLVLGIFCAASILASVAHPFALSDFLIKSQQAKDGSVMPYRLFIPKGYDPKKSYPLVLAMHGAGERGTDDTLQLTRYKLATLWAADSTQARHPSFILAPQCPLYPGEWVHTNYGKGTYAMDQIPASAQMQAALEILDTVLAQYRIDPDRIYVAGLSMGGYATWWLAMRFPTRFAAIVAICGAGDTSKAALLKNLPIWAFHGDSDHTVPVSGSRQMIAALRAAGGAPKYTEYPGVDHGSWGPALNEPALPEWLFGNKRPAAIALARPRDRGQAGARQPFVWRWKLTVMNGKVSDGVDPMLERIDGLGRILP